MSQPAARPIKRPVKRSAQRSRAGAPTGAAKAPGVEHAAPSIRERILRATLELVAAEGVAAVSNRRIAGAAGVSLGSLTYHFTSQSELLRESLLLYVDEETTRREALARALEREQASLEHVARAVERIASSSEEVPRQIAELELHLHAARDPQLRSASQRCFQAHEQIAAAALKALGIPHGERHASTVVALLSGLAVRRLAGGGTDGTGTADALLALARGLSPAGTDRP